MTATSLFIAETDRVVGVPNRRAVVRFTTSTALICGDSISIAFPQGFFSNSVDGRAQVIASSFGVPGPVAVSSTGVNNQRFSTIFSITVNSSVPAGPQTITLCGLTFNNAFGATCGVSVTTNKDLTTTYAPTGSIPGTVFGQVTAVSLTIPWANRVARRSSQTVTFSFTTQTPFPEGGGSITIIFPSNFFVNNFAACGGTPTTISVTGVPGYSLDTSTGPSSSDRFVLRGGRLPAGPYVAVFTGVTFGEPTVGSDTGIQVQTSVDAISFPGSPSGPLSGFQVTAFTLPSCVAAPLEQSTCSTASITFLTNILSLAPGTSLVITFNNPMGGGGSPIGGTPDQFMTSSGALVTGQMTDPNTITLTVQAGFGNWDFVTGPNTITLAGVSITPTFSMNAGCVSARYVNNVFIVLFELTRIIAVLSGSVPVWDPAPHLPTCILPHTFPLHSGNLSPPVSYYLTPSLEPKTLRFSQPPTRIHSYTRRPFLTYMVFAGCCFFHDCKSSQSRG